MRLDEASDCARAAIAEARERDAAMKEAIERGRRA